MKYNACIQFISSRDKCLKRALETLYRHFNNKYDYPVYVYYFDNIYSNFDYRRDIHKSISENIHFIQVPYKIPEHVKEEELFYNRTNLDYVRRNFPRTRKGYLHMCDFNCNVFTYPNSRLSEFDYVINMDDEGGFVRDYPVNLIGKLDFIHEDMAAFTTGKRLKNGKPHQGHLDCRIGLWETTKEFIDKYNLLCPELEELYNNKDQLHYLEYSDTYVFNTKIYKTEIWKNWIDHINASGGIYKYRWGDNEIYSIFCYLVNGHPIIDLEVVMKGYYNQGLFRLIQSIAPGVKG